jgi:hypothetical protein
MGNTLNNLIDKFDNFGSEEYFKTLLRLHSSDKLLQTINPYIGVLVYPSREFLQYDYTYGKTTQAIGTYYVGQMEMLLPQIVSPVNSGTAFSLLQFKLDGVIRRFLQISNGEQMSGSTSFKNFVFGLYSGANDPIPFNRSAFHVLSDVEISGGRYEPDGAGSFNQTAGGLGAFTPAIEFEIFISGYRALVI